MFGWRVLVNWGSGGRVDTAVAAARDAVAMLLFSSVGVSVVGALVVEAVPGPQPTSKKKIMNPVGNSLIESNMLHAMFEL